MLKTILSVTGKPGLYKLISSGKNLVVVESLIDKKRMPIHARDKVVSLGDIAMYTDEGEVPLQKVLSSIKEKENGQSASVAPTAKPEELKAYLGEVLPTFDRERIYNADIKKLISWYNLLTANNIDFEAKEEPVEETEESEVTEKAVEPKEKKKDTEKPAAKTKAASSETKKTAATKKVATEKKETAKTTKASIKK